MSSIKISKVQITEEQYKKAIDKGAASIIDDNFLRGFGCDDLSVVEEDGSYFLLYKRKE